MTGVNEVKPWDSFRPANGYILVEREKPPEMVGVIAVPETAMARGQTAHIRKISAEVDPEFYRIGRRVILLPFTGVEIGAQHSELIFVRPVDLIGFVEEGACSLAEGT